MGLDKGGKLILNSDTEQQQAGSMTLLVQEIERDTMKNLITTLTAVGTIAFCSNSQADITGASWRSDSGHPLASCSWGWQPTTSTLSMLGDQVGSLAAMDGAVQTDTATDPTLYLGSAVDNDTSFAWGSYQVNVYMNRTFIFTGSVGVSDPTSTWFVASETQPSTPLVSGPYAGDYEGSLLFSGGTPLAIGDELDFNYAIKFTGSTDYAFTQEMIPMQTTYVPEPSVLALLPMGWLGLAALRGLARKSV
jgi:hypothetical protein